MASDPHLHDEPFTDSNGIEVLLDRWERQGREPRSYVISLRSSDPFIEFQHQWQMHPVLGQRPPFPAEPERPLTKRQRRRLRGKNGGTRGE